jgi:hypothetical protein
MPAAPRSQFVTITAWLSLALALVGVLTGLLQWAMFAASPADQGLLDALTAGGGSGPPQQPVADPSFVLGFGLARQIRPEGEQFRRRLDPRRSDDVAVPRRRRRKVVGV